MFINYENRKDLEKICVHDSVFYGFEYKYSEKQIKFKSEYSFDRTDVSFVFNNVIYFNVQSCYFWGPGPHILWLSVEDESSHMDGLNRLIAENEQKYKPSVQNVSSIKFIQIEFQLNSGDTIFIICESVDVEETPCKESTQERIINT